MSTVQRLWLGFGRSSERTTLELGGPGSRVLLLGARSGDLAALSSVSAKEAGANPVLLDLDGSLSNRLSGYFDTFDYRAFLYDAFRLESPEAWHAQLAAAAYAAALDLSSEEEAIINSAMQVVASDGTLLSPVSVHDVMGKVEGFRGFYVDKLNGRIGSLRLFDATDDQSFRRLLEGNVIIDFHRAPYPLAAELALGLFLAKALTSAHSSGQAPGFFLVTEAHRLFRSSPRPSHSGRLLLQFLSSKSAVAFATDQPQALSPLLLESCPIRFYSSDAWHSQKGRQGDTLSGAFVLVDSRSARTEAFFPRRILSKTADYVIAKASRSPSPHLASMVLEEVERFPLSTPESIVQFLSPEFLSADVSGAIAGLQKRGALILEPKDTGSGPRVFCLTVTQDGKKLLEELRK